MTKIVMISALFTAAILFASNTGTWALSFENCSNVHGRNLCQLNGIWQARYQKSPNDDAFYTLNMFSGLAPSFGCENGTAVCQNISGSFTSFGNLNIPPSIISANTTSVGFYLEYNTSKHCQVDEQNTYFRRSSITFECGRTLGSPVVISADDCSVDFLWETSYACLSHATEVRCDAFGSDGKKRDLEVLVLKRGGHFVKNPDDKQSGADGVYINVCRDIYPGSVHDCRANSSACLVRDGQSFTIGELTNGVNITKENRLFLEYSVPPGTSVPSECSGFTPSVRINFVCPGSGRGGSKPPIVTSSINCQYNIEWWTEAACPVETLTSSTCGLNVQNHNVEIDLSPLTKETGHYDVPGSSGMKYFLNVCGSTHSECAKDQQGVRNAVCQIPTSSTADNQDGFIAGNANNYVVKYFDGQLSLTYKKGDRCGDGFRRSSVILFHCNSTAGVGSPTFNHEEHCVYYFDWETTYACVRSPTCQLTDDAGQTYDLSTLTRLQGDGVKNWEVLTGQHNDFETEYFLNICGELLSVGSDQTRSCPAGASVCAVTNVTQTSYGSFSLSTLTRQASKLKLTYEGGESCGNGKRRNTTIIFYCKMGDLESSPVFKYMSSDNCELVLTWHTAAACPLKSVTGTNCMVSDEDSGLTFDLKRLAKSGNDFYNVSTKSYDYYLNVCGDVPSSKCSSSHRAHPAACQIEQRGGARTFVLGETSQNLLYYNGFVKLVYTNGDEYGDHKHNRSAQISFLCDPKAGAGHPQFINEGNHTYVFNWYTSYVCPFASTQCMVTGTDGAQYDLSSLAKSEDDQDANWSVLGEEVPGKGRRKYYLNVCRPVNEVQSSTNRDIGCDALAGACATMISDSKESINFTNLGRPTSPPQIESEGHLILKYTSGENCTDGDVTKPFQTHIHFSCQKGALSSSPRFLERAGCTVSFEWATEAACAITESKGVFNNSMCEVKSPNSQYIFNLQPLQRKPNNPYNVSGSEQASYEINVCGIVDECKKTHDQHGPPYFAGCKKTGSHYTELMVNHSAPAYSDDGHLTITYKSHSRDSNDNFLFYEITFICNRSVAKGKPVFNSVDRDRTRFDFQTSLACEPHAVDCLVADNSGNQYDLSSLSNPDHPWTVIDSSQSRSFYLSVCRPLPSISGCQGGACVVENGTGTNLGMVQSNPQAVSNGGQDSAVTIFYMGGDICGSDHSRRYSTRILFQCSDVQGNPPVLQTDNSDPCEFYFVWQTPAACPVKKSSSAPDQPCSVTDPLYHMTFNLSTLRRQQDYHVITGGEWDFDLNVCGKLNGGLKSCKDSGACQVSHTNPTTTMHDAGKPNTTLTYEDGVVTLTYLYGQPCHQERYNRSTTFRFTCHHSQNTKPSFINESADCTYIFDWPTPKVCPPINIVECIAQGTDGSQYDLSSLSLEHKNHIVATRGETGRIFYLNICRSMLHTPRVTCPPNSAACVKTNDDKFHSLGMVTSGPRYENGRLSLTYTNGDTCIDDKTRNYTTTVHFQCDPSAQIDSAPLLTSDSDSCHVEMLWTTRAACAVSNQSVSAHSCTAVNPKSNHLFNLSSLALDTFYNVPTEDGRSFHINVCKPVKDPNCDNNAGVCVSRGSNKWSAGESSSQLVYHEGALSLHYENGAVCIGHEPHKHNTVISFICHRSTSPSLALPTNPADKPVFVSDDPHTCTHYFSWHTNLACEVQSPCSVVNQTSPYRPKVIDFSPLISETHYSVLSDAAGTKAAYYINVCRPLEPVKGVSCPPGSAACEITPGHLAKSLGYIDASEDYLTFDTHSNTVTLQYKSSRPCNTSSNPNTTVSTKIIFSCLRGSGSGSALPQLTTVTSDCVYVFEWGTELLCPPKPPAPSTPDCTFHDTVTGSTYDLSKIKPIEFEDETGKFSIDPCSNGFPNVAECKDSVACFHSKNNEVASLGRADTREIFSGALLKTPVQMTFMNGSACPAANEQKYLHIVFRCDRQHSSEPANKVQLYYDRHELCKYTLSWPTPHVCPIPSERCLIVDPNTGNSYDLSLLSSISHAASFKDKNGNKYYVNICRPIVRHDSATKDCGEDATICRVTQAGGKVVGQTFGILRSQVMEVHPSQKVIVRYTGGDRGLCTDRDMSMSTEITFICDPSLSKAPQFTELLDNQCVLRITWRTHIACADKPSEVTLDHGKFVDPKSDVTVDLSPLLSRTWITEGDLRSDASLYHYAISLTGQLQLNTLPSNVGNKCDGHTAVCQYNSKGFARKIAETIPVPPSYVITDESLEINFTSSDKCGKDPNKTSHVYIFLRCSHYSELGKPTFIYESIECGYFFQWYTNVMCTQDSIPIQTETSKPTQSSTTAKDAMVPHEVTDSHDNTVAVVVGVFVALAVLMIVFFVLRNPEGRIMAKRAARKVVCGAWSAEPAYRYIRSEELNDEGTSLFDDDDNDGVLREETSLFGAAAKDKTYRSGTGHVDVLPIGGAMDSGDENDIFEIPEVKVDNSRTRKKKGETRKQTKKAKSNNSKPAETDDLLSFIPNPKPDRAPGVGGEKVESYHDDDDVDMLDA